MAMVVVAGLVALITAAGVAADRKITLSAAFKQEPVLIGCVSAAVGVVLPGWAAIYNVITGRLPFM